MNPFVPSRLAITALLITACGSGYAMTVEEFRALPDNKLAIIQSLGVRYARPIGPRQVEVCIGMSVSKSALKPDAYRIVSFTDPGYAYEKFVRPSAVTGKEAALDAEGAAGCPFPKFAATIVVLELPAALQKGVEYHIIAQGSGAEMVTAAHCAASFVYQPAGGDAPAPGHDIDLAVLGLRKIESVGNGILCLEFGPDFSTAQWKVPENYTITRNQKPEKIVNLGRHSMVDAYLPAGWPLKPIAAHSVFLQLENPLQDGDSINVSVDPRVTGASRAAVLKFDAKKCYSNSLKVNQIGYLTDSPIKAAYLGRWMGSFPEGGATGGAKASPALSFQAEPEFTICSEADQKVVYTGKTKLIHASGEMNEGVYKVDHSGENVYLIDFTSFKKPGRYFICVSGVGRSLPFDIGDDVYKKAFEIQSYGLLAQRCGIELKPPYSDWHRIACHNKGLLETEVPRRDVKEWPKPGKSTTLLHACGGHHDAGDYNPRSHLDVAQKLMNMYELAPQKFYDGQLNIPEKGNGVPDILDEAFWALRLWRDLQDADGGVHNGTESNGDPNFLQSVELDVLGDYAFPKDAEGSYNFAGAFAQASRLWRSIGKKAEADDFLARAERAYDWAERFPDSLDEKSKGLRYLSPKAYAAAQLLQTTGLARYNKAFLEVCVLSRDPAAPVEAFQKYDQQLAFWAYVNCNPATADPTLQENARKAIIAYADSFIRPCSTMAYAFIRHPYSPINWGTGAYENSLNTILWSYQLTGDRKYLSWIIRTCDNTLGDNPMNLSWIVGAGTRTVRAPLHNSRYSHFGEVVNGIQCEGPLQKGEGYGVKETAYPALRDNVACLYTFVDAHFAIGMDEGIVPSYAQSMAIFGFLLPDRKSSKPDSSAHE